MLSDLFFRLRSIFRRNTVESELDEELRFHFEKQVEKHLQAGLKREATDVAYMTKIATFRKPATAGVARRRRI